MNNPQPVIMTSPHIVILNNPQPVILNEVKDLGQNNGKK